MNAWLISTLGQGGLSPVWVFATLFLATFVLEDAVTVAAGLLASRMLVDPMLAVSAVVAGTIAGDIALHVAGRWLSGTRLVAQWRGRSGSAEQRLRRHGLLAVGLARFVPGTRLPVFLASGLVRTPFFASFWVIVATTTLWTPGIFLVSFSAANRLPQQFLSPWPIVLILVLIAVFPAVRKHLPTKTGETGRGDFAQLVAPAAAP